MLKQIRQFVRDYPVLSLFGETLSGLTLSIGSFLLFIHLRSEVFEKELVSLDAAVWHFFYTLRSPILTTVMVWLSYLGSELLVALAFILIAVLVWKKHTREAILLGFLVSTSILIDTGLKMLIQRPRPGIAPLLLETDSSFPSGHAMNSFVFYIGLAYLSLHFWKNTKRSLILLIGALFLVGLIGISRIYLGVHYASDVLAGYIAGFWWVITVIVLEKTTRILRLFRE